MGMFTLVPLEEKPIEPVRFVEKFKIQNIVCFFSGGKDSMVSTHYTLSKLGNIELNKYVLWIDTTVMLPVVGRFVRKVAREFGWSLVVVRPEKDFEDYALRFGAPTMFRRWCCYYLKLRPAFNFLKSLKGRTAEVLGLRWDESARRRRYPPVFLRKETKTYCYCPIVSWSEREVSEYISRNGLPLPPWYSLGINETCVCGAFSSYGEIKKTCALFPEFFKRFVEMEKKFRSGGAAFFLKGRPYYAREIWEEVHNSNDSENRRGASSPKIRVFKGDFYATAEEGCGR